MWIFKNDFINLKIEIYINSLNLKLIIMNNFYKINKNILNK